MCSFSLCFLNISSPQTEFTYVLGKKDYSNVFVKAKETTAALGREKLLRKKKMLVVSFFLL